MSVCHHTFNVLRAAHSVLFQYMYMCTCKAIYSLTFHLWCLHASEWVQGTIIILNVWHTGVCTWCKSYCRHASFSGHTPSFSMLPSWWVWSGCQLICSHSYIISDKTKDSVNNFKIGKGCCCFLVYFADLKVVHRVVWLARPTPLSHLQCWQNSEWEVREGDMMDLAGQTIYRESFISFFRHS